MKKIITFLMVLITYTSFAQVAINTTGNNPDASAGLEVNFSNKGLLIPRVALISNNDATTILTPAVSLLVYNTGTSGLLPSGYYYNAGTSVSPNWVQIFSSNNFSILSNGSGISSLNYNGTSPEIISVIFGTTSGTVAEGNHSHTGMVTGAGTTNYNTYWTGTNAIGAEQYVAINRGGTGIGNTPTNGQLLIGTGSGYSLSNITAGSGVTIANGSGNITISATGSGGTVSSIASGIPGSQSGTSGLTFSTNPITTSGSIALSNTGVTSGNYGNTGAYIPNITVDAQGRLTLATNRTLVPSDLGLASIIYNNLGSGAASGSSYNGTTALTISYNTIGAVGGSGTSTRLAFWSGANTLSSNANLYWDNTNSRLGVGTSVPATQLHTTGSVRFANYASGANGALLRTTSAGDLGITNFSGSANDVLLGNGTFGSPATSATAWQLTGNNGTNSTNNFIGTTDNIDFVIRTYNTERIRITNDGNVGIKTSTPRSMFECGSGVGNVSIFPTYSSALDYGTAGIGFNLIRLSSGTWQAKTDGSNNGGAAIYGGIYNGLSFITIENTGGADQNLTDANIYPSKIRMVIKDNGKVGISQNNPGATLDVGGHIWQTNTGQSVFIGEGAGQNDDLSDNLNVFIGYQAGKNNLSGYGNVSVGYKSLFTNKTGYLITSFGYNSLLSNTIGMGNSAFGANALLSNIDGNSNDAFGRESLFYNENGFNNTACGSGSLHTNKTGNYNTACGNSALFHNNFGEYNVGVGYCAGFNPSFVATNFYQTTIIGANSYISAPLYNVSLIGFGITQGQCTGSNQVLLGNTAITQIRAQVSGITTYSDARFKNKIKDDVHGLDFIRKLKPVTYNENPEILHQIWGTPDSLLKNIDHSEIKEQRMIGFLAQDVEKAADESGWTFPGIDIPKNNNEVYSLRYSDFIMPIVKSIQELDKENSELKEIVRKQSQEIEDLKKKVNKE